MTHRSFLTRSLLPVLWFTSVCLLALGGSTTFAAPLLTFGDSLTATSGAPALYFGVPYNNGRWSNGNVWADYYAASSGAVLGSTWFNYAAGGAQTGHLSAQVTSVSGTWPNATAVVWCGGNDMINNGSVTDPGTWSTIVQTAVTKIREAVQRLYDVNGVREFYVLNVPNIGAIPSFASSSNKSVLTTQTKELNAALHTALGTLLASRTSMRLHEVNVFAQMNTIIASPGPTFTDATTPGFTIGGGSFTGAGANYLFWDYIHPTSKAHQVIAGWVSSAAQTPITPDIAVFTNASTSVVNERASGQTFTFNATPVNGNSAAQTFTIQNTGAANLTGITVTKTGDFTVSPVANASLSAGQSMTFTVNFAPQASGLRTGTITIASNDSDEASFTIAVEGTGQSAPAADLTLSASPSSLYENSAGNLTYTFSRTGSTASALTVNFNISGSATFNSDYAQSGAATFNGSSGTVVIPAGSSSATVGLDPSVDAVAEADETITLTLAAGSGYTVVTTTGITTTIYDVPPPPVVNVTVSPTSVAEDGTTSLAFTFTRDSGFGSALVVNYSVGGSALGSIYIDIAMDGEGDAGDGSTDYYAYGANNFTSTSGAVTILAGHTSATVTADPIADFYVETDETVTFTLSGNANYTIGSQAAATGYLLNEDVPTVTVTSSAGPNGSISPYPYQTINAGSSVSFTATPNANYMVSTWLVNGSVAQLGGTWFTLANVNANTSVQVTFTTFNLPTLLTPSPQSRIIAVSSDGGSSYPVGESPLNAIDGAPTAKYLNFSAAGAGFIVTPAVPTIVTAFKLWTANDFPERDPMSFTLYGTNDAIASTDNSLGDLENWTLIGNGSMNTPSTPHTATVVLQFPNSTIYRSYKWLCTATRLPSPGAMQFGEIQFYGSIPNLPNLRFFQVPNSSDTAVISNVSGTITNGTNLRSTDTLYVDFYPWSNGAAPADAPWSAKIYVDNVLKGQVSGRTLPPGNYDPIFVDNAIGSFTPGQHNLSIVLDADSSIYESDEADNNYTRSFTIIPDVSVTAVAPSVPEDHATGTLVYQFIRNSDPLSNLTVNFTVSGTATYTTDYTQGGATTFNGSSGTVTIPFGSAQAIVALDPVADTLVESDETAILTVTSSSTYTAVGSAATGTITNDDSTTMSIGGVSINEGNSGATTASFTVTLSAASTLTTSATYTTADGTATTADGDYTPATGLVTFAPGQTSQTVTVNVNGDTKYESNDAFTVTLSTPINATLGTATGTCTINNDDGAPSLSIASASKAEGNSGSSTLSLTVTLSPVSGVATTVNYATANGTATTADADYTATSGSLSFAPGETSKTIAVTVNGDAKYEINETFTVTLSGSSNATIATAVATGTITNDDTAPALSIAAASVTEGNSGTAALSFTVTLSSASGLGCSVNYATSNGTATTSDNDYVAASGTLTFTAGEVSRTISVTVNGDTKREASETVVMTLSGASDATIASATANGTITNDDAPPSVSIAGASVTEGNSATTNATLTVTLSAASGESITVDYATSDGTAATADNDYTSRVNTLTFPPGVTSQPVTIAVTGDTKYESNENFTVTLSAPTNATLGTATGTCTINNDDVAPSLSIASTSKAEGNSGSSTLNLTVTLSPVSGVATTVNYTTANGTGTTADADYTAASGSLSFAPGETSKTIAVTVNGDAKYETSETFSVTLSGASNATIATAVATATITNDDTAPALSIAAASVTEGQAGTATLSFTVSLSSASGLGCSFNYVTSNGSATTADGDYVATSGSMSIPAGATSNTILVSVNGDTKFETAETITLTLSSPLNATLGTAAAAGTINNDDAAPAMAIGNATVTEGNSGATTATFTVTLTGTTALAAGVSFATSNGTALLADSDYAYTSGSLTFAPGVTSQTVTVAVNGDTKYEPAETFLVILSAPTNATIATATGTGTISNDDAPSTNALLAELSSSGGAMTPTFSPNTFLYSQDVGNTVTSIFVTGRPSDSTATLKARIKNDPFVELPPGVASQVLPLEVGPNTVEVQVTAQDSATTQLYTLTVNRATAPEIAVFAGASTALVDELSHLGSPFFMGIIPDGTWKRQTFTIQNRGTAPLTVLEIFPTVPSFTGPGAIYIDTAQTATSLQPNATTTFLVTFHSPTLPTLTRTVEIHCNDADEQPFKLRVSGNGIPSVRFDEAERTEIENAKTITVPVRLSAAAGSAFTVPVLFAGSATNATDYTRSTSVLSFSATQLEAKLTLTVKDDLVVEGDETIIVTLGEPSTSNVGLGSMVQFTLTITEDDVMPWFSTAPNGAIVHPDEPVLFTATAFGSAPMTLQWKKNGTLMSGATGTSFLIPTAASSHVANYTVTATNTRGAVTSANAPVVIVDNTPAAIPVNEDSTLVLLAPVSAPTGTPLTYLWRKNGVALVNGGSIPGQVISGAQSALLSITKANTDTAGIYTCQVFSHNGTRDSGPMTVSIRVKPQLTALGPLSWRVSQPVTEAVIATANPSTFSFTGLPSGITGNKTTGLLSGRPTSAGSGIFTVTAANAAGTSSPLRVSYTVSALPTRLVGTFNGLVARNAVISAPVATTSGATLRGHGGCLSNLVVTSNGSFTGKLILEEKSYSMPAGSRLAATADGNASATVRLVRGTATDAIADLTLAFTINGQTGELTGTLADTNNASATTAVQAWHNPWKTTSTLTSPANPATGLAGAYTALLSLPVELRGQAANPQYPQGHGYVTVAITNSGIATWGGKLADGTPITGGTTLGPDGELPLHLLLYTTVNAATAGSLHGWLTAQPDDGVERTNGGHPVIDGSVDWLKLPQAPSTSPSGRSYREGFLLHTLTVIGGKYVKPATGPVLGWNDGAGVIVFGEGGLDHAVATQNTGDELLQPLRITNTNSVVLPPSTNPQATVTMTMAATTGLFSGSFSLKDDPDPTVAGAKLARPNIAYAGVLVPRLGRGVGHFQLQQLPQSGPPKTTLATSPRLSGWVELDAAP